MGVRVLGLSGGLDKVYQNRGHLFPRSWAHDAASVLMKDGQVVHAIEEERLNRIKHTSKGAVSAVRYCLAQNHMRLNDLDYVAAYGTEAIYDSFIRDVNCGSSEISCPNTVRQLVHELLVDELSDDIDDSKLIFVPHHLCHILSAYFDSGYRDALVITMDGGGDGLSGTVSYVDSNSLSVLQASPITKSLGVFYDTAIAVIGFGFTEEYKVMGLAPYGNPERFRQTFRNLYARLPQGDYVLRWDRIGTLNSLFPARKKHDALEQVHADFAAALQEMLEDIILHVVRYFRQLTGKTRLCLAGGVAHNCSVNGKLLYTQLFDDIFVHPAAHDAGCAVGAAFYPFSLASGFALGGTVPTFSVPQVQCDTCSRVGSELRTVYWGSDIGNSDAIQAEVSKWHAFVGVESVENIAQRAAQMISEGAVLGWVQGRSEFGPRALGNRSIVADPRHPEKRDIVNAMVKKREAYRPFAPAILEEYAHEYFDLPADKIRFPFMTFVVRVRPEKRELLGATTHVDGTARIQTVSREDNERFWELINNFREITGVPVLLNTSFNNNQEPIVECVNDAIVSFITTGLTHLVIGDFLITKRVLQKEAFTTLYPSLPRHAHLISRHAHGPTGVHTTNMLANTYNDSIIPVSEPAYRLLLRADGDRTIANLFPESTVTDSEDSCLNELYELWCLRAITLSVTAKHS